MGASPKPPNLPQVKIDFNKASGAYQTPTAPKPPQMNLNPPRAAVAAPVPGGRAAPMKTPPPAHAVAARAAAAKAPPKKPPFAAAAGQAKAPAKLGPVFKTAAAGAAPMKAAPQPAAQAQAQRALQLKRDFARAAAQRKGGKGKAPEKQHTKKK